jgi:hypothetical protein
VKIIVATAKLAIAGIRLLRIRVALGQLIPEISSF